MKNLIHTIVCFLFLGIGILTALVVVAALYDPRHFDKTWLLFFLVLTMLSFLISWSAWRHP